MKTKLLRLARKNFCHELAPITTQRHNIRAWVRSLRILGDKWLLAKHINK